MALVAFNLPARSQVIDQVVAVVGKNIILQSDIENQYIQYRLQRGISGSAKTIRCTILEDLLFQKLLLNWNFVLLSSTLETQVPSST